MGTINAAVAAKSLRTTPEKNGPAATMAYMQYRFKVDQYRKNVVAALFFPKSCCNGRAGS
jgi:hypothetical protein